MARIDGISGSVANPMSQTKSRPQNTEIRVSDAAPREQRLDIPIVTAAGGKGDSQTDTRRQDEEIFGKDVTPEQARAAVGD